MSQIPASVRKEQLYVSVHGSQMHYVDQGQGQPMVLLHGMPTSAYVFRKLIPALTDSFRCVAPDLIGMGFSDKPEIAYSIDQHIEYFIGFMQAMNFTKPVVLLVQGWGSIIGMAYARRFPDQVKALVMLEPYLLPSIEPKQMSLPMHELASILREDPQTLKDRVLNTDFLVDLLLSLGSLNRMGEQELQAYQAPFFDAKSRQVLWQYLQELPISGRATAAQTLIIQNSEWLMQSQIPKLLIYGMPGFIMSMSGLRWAAANIPQLKIYECGDGMHFLTESTPQEIAELVEVWSQTILQSQISREFQLNDDE